MDEEQNVVAPATGGNNKKMMILIIGLLVVLIGVVVAVAIYIVGLLGQESQPSILEVLPPPPRVEDITFINISHPINTNLLGGPDGRQALITLNFSIGVNHSLPGGEDLIDLISSAEPIVRSIAISVVRNMTALEINTIEGHTEVSNEILRRLQDEFQTNLITGIFILDIMTA